MDICVADRPATISFDCMYIKGPNNFYTEGDNGYANVSYFSPPDYTMLIRYSLDSG